MSSCANPVKISANAERVAIKTTEERYDPISRAGWQGKIAAENATGAP
jgi:hypothetical protein